MSGDFLVFLFLLTVLPAVQAAYAVGYSRGARQAFARVVVAPATAAAAAVPPPPVSPWVRRALDNDLPVKPWHGPILAAHARLDAERVMASDRDPDSWADYSDREQDPGSWADYSDRERDELAFDLYRVSRG